MDVSIFHDFDEYTASVQDVDHDMALHRMVRRLWRIWHLDIDGVHIQQGCQGSGDITQGQAKTAGYFLYLPLKHAEIQRANGVALDANTIAILEPGCEFCLSSNLDHQWCSVFIPTDQLVGILPVLAPSPARCRVVRLPDQAWNRYRDLIRGILRAAEIHDQALTAPGGQSALRHLLSLSSRVIQLGASSNKSPKGRPPVTRAEIVRRTTAVVEANLNRSLSVGDMASACGVSERTLRNVFMDYYQVAPLRYFQLQKLHQIHRALRAAEPRGVTVSAVLAQHGEYEFGRFAQRYRAVFGELPSETLATPTSDVSLLSPDHIRDGQCQPLLHY